jgi:hypothetical protein
MASVRHAVCPFVAYGSLSVILVFHLIGIGLTEVQAGLVLTLTLAGDVLVSFGLSSYEKTSASPRS